MFPCMLGLDKSLELPGAREYSFQFDVLCRFACRRSTYGRRPSRGARPNSVRLELQELKPRAPHDPTSTASSSIQYLPHMATGGTVTAFGYILTNLRKYPLPPPPSRWRPRATHPRIKTLPAGYIQDTIRIHVHQSITICSGHMHAHVHRIQTTAICIQPQARYTKIHARRILDV